MPSLIPYEPVFGLFSLWWEAGKPPPHSFVSRSTYRRCVLEAALVPQRVQTTLDLERAGLTDVAFEDFAIVADALDDVVGPFVGEPHVGADFRIGFRAEE